MCLEGNLKDYQGSQLGIEGRARKKEHSPGERVCYYEEDELSCNLNHELLNKHYCV